MAGQCKDDCHMSGPKSDPTVCGGIGSGESARKDAEASSRESGPAPPALRALASVEFDEPSEWSARETIKRLKWLAIVPVRALCSARFYSIRCDAMRCDAIRSDGSVEG